MMEVTFYYNKRKGKPHICKIGDSWFSLDAPTNGNDFIVALNNTNAQLWVNVRNTPEDERLDWTDLQFNTMGKYDGKTKS